MKTAPQLIEEADQCIRSGDTSEGQALAMLAYAVGQQDLLEMNRESMEMQRGAEGRAGEHLELQRKMANLGGLGGVLDEVVEFLKYASGQGLLAPAALGERAKALLEKLS